MLKDEDFNVENLELEDACVKTFVDKLHDIIKNSGVDTGISESVTDTLVNDLLVRIVNLDDWPFKVRWESNYEKIFLFVWYFNLLNLLILILDLNNPLT